MSFWHDLNEAKGMLTIIPTSSLFSSSRCTTKHFPTIGLFLGIVLFIVAQIPILPPDIMAIILVATLTILTGALHIDGFADSFDAMGGGTIKQRHTILKDPRLGTFGLCAIILLLSLKIMLIIFILRHHAYALLIIFPMIGRLSVCFLPWICRPHQKNSLYGILCQNTRFTDLLYAGILPIGIMIGIGFSKGWMMSITIGISATLSIMLAIALSLWQEKRLNGITGDTCGASIETAETLFLLCALLS